MSTVLVWNPSTRKYPTRPASISAGTSVGWMGPYKPSLMGPNDVWTESTLPVYTPAPAPVPVPTPAPTPTPTPAPAAKTLWGWTGPDPAGMPKRPVIGCWMAKDTWERMARAEWLSATSDYMGWLAANPKGAADIGVPLIPYEISPWQSRDALYDMVAAGAPLTGVSALDGTPCLTTDDVFRAMGAQLAAYVPATAFLRLDWEHNLYQHTPSKLIAAWRRAVPLIRQGFASKAKAQTAQIVFCPSLAAVGTGWQQDWPGDDVADIVGVDAYGHIWGTTTPGVQQLVSNVTAILGEITTFAKAHGKPWAVCEWGNVAVRPQGVAGTQGRGDCPEYVDAVAGVCKSAGAAYTLYYNLAADVDITLAQTPNALARLIAAAS